LVVRVLPAHESGTPEGATHQQAPVSAEQHPVLTFGLLDQIDIAGIVAISRVNPQESKPSGQRAKVYIQQEECRSFQRLWPGPGEDVEAVLLLEPTAPGYRGLRYHQVPDLGQGYPRTLDKVPHGGGWVVGQVKLTALATAARQ